jgi:Phosphotransferase enzyme family
VEFDRISRVVRDLVLSNKAQIFPGAESLEILDVALGPQRYRSEDRYHRSVVVHYRNNGLTDAVILWLKFRPGLDQIYPVLVAYHDRLKQQVFPTPYFVGHCPNEGAAFLATAYISGSVLRNRLLWRGALRRTAELEPIFRSNGAKMRRFHDAFPASQEIGVADVVAQATELTQTTPYFTAKEKDVVLAHLARCRALLPAALPAVLTHNDWLLKNIIVTPDGTDYVIDCDSMRHRPNWRWFDIVYLLLNVESQRKWAPLVTLRMMASLWRAFWLGYLGDVGVPDGLTMKQVAAILYIVRIEWLVGGTVRPPYFEIMSGPRSERLQRALKDGVLRGRYSMFDFLDVTNPS